MYVYVINNLANCRQRFLPHFTDKKTDLEQLLCPTQVSSNISSKHDT